MAPSSPHDSNLVEQFHYDEDVLEQDDHTFTTLRELNKGGYSLPLFQTLRNKDRITTVLIAVVLIGLTLGLLRAKYMQQEGVQKKARSMLSITLVALVAYVVIQSFNKQRKISS